MCRLSSVCCNAVCGGSSSSISFHVSRSRVRILVNAMFCDVTPKTTHINQSIKLFRQIFSIDWPLQKVGRRKKRKNELDWGFKPQTWKRGIWKGTGTATVCLIAALARHTQSNHAVEDNRETALMIAYCFTQCCKGCSIRQLAFSASTDLWPEEFENFCRRHSIQNWIESLEELVSFNHTHETCKKSIVLTDIFRSLLKFQLKQFFPHNNEVPVGNAATRVFTYHEV